MSRFLHFLSFDETSSRCSGEERKQQFRRDELICRGPLIHTRRGVVLIASLSLIPRTLAGNNRGVSITPSTLNPLNQTRSDSKAGYIDPLPPRDNLVILTGFQVTAITWSSTAKEGSFFPHVPRPASVRFVSKLTPPSFQLHFTLHSCRCLRSQLPSFRNWSGLQRQGEQGGHPFVRSFLSLLSFSALVLKSRS